MVTTVRIVHTKVLGSVKKSFCWLYFGSDNLMGEKYQIKIREYEHKTTQMCTEKYLDYPIRTRA